jgi:hypothetical protein
MIKREITFLPETFDILKETQRKLMDVQRKSLSNSEVIARILSAISPDEIASTQSNEQ